MFDEQSLRSTIQGVVQIDRGGAVTVTDAPRLRTNVIEALARHAIFAEKPAVRDASRWLIRKAGEAVGVTSASILPLYMARGRGECSGFTVPAINIRTLTYDVARAACRAAKRIDAAAVVFEIARSEIRYTEQRPSEYAAAVTAAAIREDFRGPLFIQGDHFQVSASAFYKGDREKELAALRALIEEALTAGFLNIDIDSSTLVVLERPTIDAQQEENCRIAAELTAHVHKHAPAGVAISIGGEIGEVGGKNSTVEELRAYMRGYRKHLGEIAPGAGGISKISVQTGTTHGGVPLPDGTIAKVAVDFDTLRELSILARKEFGMAGAVQHGASTLPEELFGKFPDVETAEIHLATGFQNLIYDHPQFPSALRADMYAHLAKAHADERKAGMSDQQFYYKTRKQALGPFKRTMWDLPTSVRDAIGADLERTFSDIFARLRLQGTRAVVERFVKPTPTTPRLAEHLAAVLA
jgi:fructose/tagatose bisphosphate aldolase